MSTRLGDYDRMLVNYIYYPADPASDVAVPTIALAVTTTLASLGRQQAARRIFGQTLGYTLLTTVVAAAVGLGLARLEESQPKTAVINLLLGLQ